MTSRLVLALAAVLVSFNALADEAGDLARQLATPAGSVYVRLRMEFGGGSLQVQSKERRGNAGTEIAYQILFPKERKSEGFVLRKTGGRVSGAVFTLPDSVKELSGGDLDRGVFGSALTYEDILDDFFLWPNQKIVGTEAVGKTECQVLESKPGKGGSSYGSVRSWIDTKRMVPMRVEKLSSGGKVIARIETTNIEKDDLGRNLPASLSIQRGGSTTVIEGSRIRHNVDLSDADFTPEGLKTISIPRSAN
jgi:hypothetical protein